MDWLKIGSALFLVAMLVFIYPRMKHMIKNSPKGTMKDWMGFIIPIAGVALFIAFLIASVR
ncbi:hypothetical protein MNBD_GAMMA21-1399 [hydrothermal vent metagenome]|uniref:Uncharacterized protein n=1 Tax=hydrothermal vent metagenome TaxID=652676 RepID=A0A3B1A2L4_9ZZZZ